MDDLQCFDCRGKTARGIHERNVGTVDRRGVAQARGTQVADTHTAYE